MIFVPTAVDAFFSEIFQPIADHKRPTSGTTLDLEDPGCLKDGVPEFAVYPINVDEAGIELVPVNLRTADTRRHKVYRDYVSDALLKHYRTLTQG